MKILIIAPHADDESLSMGGTIANYINQGFEVNLVILTGPSEKPHEFISNDLLKTIRTESKRAIKILGIKNTIYLNYPPVTLIDLPQYKFIKSLQEIIYDITPDYIFLPFANDLHKDHRHTSYAVNVICRPYLESSKKLKKVLAYETLSETNLDFYQERFKPNVYFDISDTLDRKLDALKEYKSQLQKSNQPRTLDVIKALATLRGSHIGVKYAEAFMLLGEYLR